jgi:hypothetical protein
MNLATLVGVVVGAASCSHAHSEGLPSVAGVATPDYCEMAVVALAETIKSNREQPCGLKTHASMKWQGFRERYTSTRASWRGPS